MAIALLIAAISKLISAIASSLPILWANSNHSTGKPNQMTDKKHPSSDKEGKHQTKHEKEEQEQLRLSPSMFKVLEAVITEIAHLKKALDSYKAGDTKQAVIDILDELEHIIVDQLWPLIVKARATPSTQTGIKDADNADNKWDEREKREEQMAHQAELEKLMDKVRGEQPHVYLDYQNSPIGNHPHDKTDQNPAQVEHKPERKFERH
jgi:hypothetical protein